MEMLWIQSVPFEAIQFLQKLQMGSVSWSVTLHRAVEACKGKHSSLLDPFLKKEKMKSCEYSPIQNTCMGPLS